MQVDFHVHSTASDGSVPPAELVARAKGYAALALTDHDNCDGVAAAAAASRAADLRFVPGIELSIDPGESFHQFHLLGLGIDPTHPALTDFLRRVLEGRNARNARITENFRRLGIVMEDIADYAHGEVLARPHYARWLVDHGLARDIPDAFARYLQPDSPAETRCYETRYKPSQAEAFAVIHAAGGLCVMAHPRYWRREWKSAGCDYAAAERELARLKEAGLDGLEAFYQANTFDENIRFARLADRFGLLKSAGSDFHGANKAAIPLGMDVPEDFIRPLFERLLMCK